MSDKQTVGKVARDLMLKEPESRDPIEIQQAMEDEYLDNLIECVDKHNKEFETSFYVVVITKNEKLMENVFRNYFFARKTCPTPDYDQTVFFYNKNMEQVEYIWTIPSKDACHYLKDNALRVATEEKGILNFVLQFSDGTLGELCKKLNGEIEIPTILLN